MPYRTAGIRSAVDCYIYPNSREKVDIRQAQRIITAFQRNIPCKQIRISTMSEAITVQKNATIGNMEQNGTGTDYSLSPNSRHCKRHTHGHPAFTCISLF